MESRSWRNVQRHRNKGFMSKTMSKQRFSWKTMLNALKSVKAFVIELKRVLPNQSLNVYFLQKTSLCSSYFLMGYDDDVGRKRKAFTLVDDAAIEDDDVDEDDEDEIEEPPRSRHNRNVARYIDDEVEVQDDDTEEEEESEIYGEDIPDIAETDDKPSLHRRYAAAHDIAGEEDVDLLEAYINERYRTVEVAVDATTANEQSLVPNQMDPKLWIVQCRPGYERSLCLQLLNKFVHCRGKGMPLLIKSAISLDHLKGYLYVEAEKESHVAAAVSGMRYVQHTKKIKLVPLKEMVAAITPNRVAKLPIEIGSWVRVRNGPYAQDLAKVIHVDHAHRKIDLKVVPRIDFVDLLHRQEGRYINRSRDPFGKKAKVRPRATRFCPDECRALGLVVERRKGMDGETLLAVGNYIFHDGYLIKTMSMRSILVEDAASFEEIQAFESASSKGTMKDDTQTGIPRMPQRRILCNLRSAGRCSSGWEEIWTLQRRLYSCDLWRDGWHDGRCERSFAERSYSRSNG